MRGVGIGLHRSSNARRQVVLKQVLLSFFFVMPAQTVVLHCATALLQSTLQLFASLLADLGVRRLVDAVVCSSHAGSAKPDPAIFAAALAALGVPAPATLHVGDEPVADVQGARAAGLSAILVCRSGAPPVLPADVATIASLGQLPALLADSFRG